MGGGGQCRIKIWLELTVKTLVVCYFFRLLADKYQRLFATDCQGVMDGTKYICTTTFKNPLFIHFISHT